MLFICLCMSIWTSEAKYWVNHTPQYTVQDHWWFCKALCSFSDLYIYSILILIFYSTYPPLSSQTQFCLVLQTSFGLYICLWNMNCFMYIVIFKIFISGNVNYITCFSLFPKILCFYDSFAVYAAFKVGLVLNSRYVCIYHVYFTYSLNSGHPGHIQLHEISWHKFPYIFPLMDFF